MRIQLLSPAGEIHRNTTGIFKTALRYAPLTLTTLAAMVPADVDADITIQDEGVQPLDLDFPPSLVGITAITGTALRSYDIADQLRAKGHTVVIGGVHATLMPEEAARHADTDRHQLCRAILAAAGPRLRRRPAQEALPHADR